ncbi:MAG: oxygen-insensitive NADPH nitroreductase [Saccharospirillum sp.]|jgi:nitroreductase
MNDVIQLLQRHRSIRKYTDQNIDQSVVEELIKAGQAAATSSFIQACTVIQVARGERRDRLAELANNQAYVANAPVFLVFCADMHRHKVACEQHEAEMLSGFTEQFLTASVDVALFAQNLVVAAESLGLGICYIGALRNKIDAVADLLELPDLVYPVFGLCLGYPAQDPEVKPRLPVSVVLKQESYNEAGNTEALAQYDAHVNAYYRSRSETQKDLTWTGQIAGMLQKEARPHMLPFLKEKGFLLR